ncbi:MAG: DNA polymerase III subunit delta [Acidimicrobiales bacterium]
MASLHLIRGDDPSLIDRAVHDLVDALVDGGDRSLMVEVIDESRYLDDNGDPNLRALVDAAQTPPFLTDQRVVVGRALGRFANAAAIAPLVGYLGAPLDTTRLVLVWEKGADQQRLSPVPKPLQALVDAQGQVIDVKVPRGRGTEGWVAESAAAAGVDLDRSAIRALTTHVGDDHAQVPAILTTLHATFGDSTRVTAAMLAPYLGAAGDVAPWELTDKIGDGDVVGSLAVLSRMSDGGGRHPLQILATLTAHYGRVLRLEGSGISNEKDAAAALGMKGSTFPAKKALQLARSMGRQRVRRAIELLADADLAVRGTTAVEPRATMEVLVARLATLHR